MQTFASQPFGGLTIGEMAVRYGVSFRTLRFYEQRGLLHPRRDHMSRFYSERDEIRLQLILKGKRLGFSLKEISDLIADQVSAEAPAQMLPLSNDLANRQMVRLEKRREEVDRAIDELRLALA